MKLLAIDGNSLINRAYYGVRPLSSPKGVPTNAVYGFLNMYFKLLDDFSPELVCVCFDLKAPTFRHLKYEGYKAQRKPMPEDLCAQMPIIKDILDKMGVPRMEVEGYEADDLLGTLARESGKENIECVIVTGDRDSLQFIAQGARVALITTRMGNSSTELYDEKVFAEKYCGLTPDKIVDLKAVMGDASDNIPGVRGIGEKGALKLLCDFGSLDKVYENIEDGKISASVREKLKADRDMAYLSYELATGCVTAPITAKPAELSPGKGDPDGLYDLLSDLGLKSIISKLSLLRSSPAPERPESAWKAPEYKIISDEKELTALAGNIEDEITLLLSREMNIAAFTDKSGTYVFNSIQTGNAFNAFLRGISGKSVNAHDCKTLASALLKEGVEPPRFVFDSALADYLLDSTEGDHSVRRLAERYLSATLPEPLFNDGDALDFLGGGEESMKAAALYCAADAALRDPLEKALSDTSQLDLMRDIELPTSAVLAEMENAGILIDKERLSAFGEETGAKAEALAEEIYALAGERFNISSPKQLSDVLFDKMGLPHGKKNKTGAYATDADTLSSLRFHSEIIEKILDYRKLTKLKSTYVEGLFKAIKKDGAVYTTFNQTVTATGRLSSTDPNLQNLPVRREEGAEIRKCFIPRDGYIFVDADYSQIELRILAHIADDDAMKEAFEKGEDIHRVTAASAFGVPVSMVTPLMRSRAKAVNFGIVYGISAFSLAQDIGVSVKEAQGYINAYLEHFSGVREYMERVKKDAAKNGFVSTIFGRRRYLPELRSSNRNIAAFGERVALNAPIQGSAADIIKKAMIDVRDRLKKEKLRARLVLQVHDELIIECRKEDTEHVKALLKEEMENAARLSVTLTADVSSGDNLYDAKG